MLHPENHHPVMSEDGITFVFQSPSDIAQDLASSQEPRERSMTSLRLQTTYTSPTIWDAPTDTLITDLTAARQFADDPLPGPVHPADPIAAVAAAAIAAHARNRAEVPDDHLRWAAGVLAEVAAHPWAEARSARNSDNCQRDDEQRGSLMRLDQRSTDTSPSSYPCSPRDAVAATGAPAAADPPRVTRGYTECLREVTVRISVTSVPRDRYDHFGFLDRH
jgi:hypothetical protein